MECPHEGKITFAYSTAIAVRMVELDLALSALRVGGVTLT